MPQLACRSQSVVLSDAVEDGLIATNPAISKGSRRRRLGTISRAERLKSIRSMTWEQREAFLRIGHDFDPLYGVLFALMVKTGPRPRESVALRVEDLDLHARRLRAERAFSMGEIKDTKTSDWRDVDLSNDLAIFFETTVA